VNTLRAQNEVNVATKSVMDCRLLYLIGQLRAGGSERQLCYLLQGIDRERYPSAVAVWNYCEDDVYVSQLRGLGVPLYPLPKVSSGFAKLRAFRSLVLQLRPEVVHSCSFYTNVGAYGSVWGTRILGLGSMRSDIENDKQRLGPWLGRLAARWPRHQIWNSSVAADKARRSRTIFKPASLWVIRNGLDLKSFPHSSLPSGAKSHILAIGSLIAEKRWDRLLTAVWQLKQRGLYFRLRLVGDGPLRDALCQQVKKLNLGDRVELVGYLDNVSKALRDATFLAHSADIEGCPNVVMEAMACGRAVVATDAGDVPLLVEDGKTGFVVHCGDDELFVERLATLITDPNLCRRMGEAGRAKAQEAFTLSRLITETFSAYRAAGWKDV